MLAQRGMAESVPVVKPRKQAEVHDDQDLTLELAAILLIVSLKSERLDRACNPLKSKVLSRS